MDTHSIAASVVGVIPIVASLASSLASTEHNIHSETERLHRLVVDLGRTLNETGRPLQTHNEQFRHLKNSWERYERMLSEYSDLLAQCRPNATSNRAFQNIWQEKWEGERRDISSLGDTCTTLLHSCRQDVLRSEPTFWKLQRWVVNVGEEPLLFLRIRIPEAIKRPSPTTLLVSWLVMALAAVAYYETCPAHRYRRVFLLGSAFLAMFIGVVEGSSTETIILANIPWCLTLGMLLDFLTHSLIGVLSRGLVERRLLVEKEQCREKEKVASV